MGLNNANLSIGLRVPATFPASAKLRSMHGSQ